MTKGWRGWKAWPNPWLQIFHACSESHAYSPVYNLYHSQIHCLHQSTNRPKAKSKCEVAIVKKEPLQSSIFWVDFIIEDKLTLDWPGVRNHHNMITIWSSTLDIKLLNTSPSLRFELPLGFWLTVFPLLTSFFAFLCRVSLSFVLLGNFLILSSNAPNYFAVNSAMQCFNIVQIIAVVFPMKIHLKW